MFISLTGSSSMNRDIAPQSDHVDRMRLTDKSARSIVAKEFQLLMESLKRKTDKMHETDDAKRICAAPLYGRVTIFVERARACTRECSSNRELQNPVLFGVQLMKRSNIYGPYRVEF